MLATMEQISPLAIAEFNKNVLDQPAQEYFVYAFDLWQGCYTIFSLENNAYKIVVKRYAQPINEELARIRVALGITPTKRISALNDTVSHDIEQTDKHSTADIDSLQTENDGEYTQNLYTYPDGYTQAPDTAYISSQNVENPYTQTDTTKGKTDVSENSNVTKNSDVKLDTSTQESDEIARTQLLNYSPKLGQLIERCVFEFLANTVSGVL